MTNTNDDLTRRDSGALSDRQPAAATVREGSAHTPGPWSVSLGRVVPEAPVFGFAILAAGKSPAVCGAGVSERNLLILARDYRHLEYAKEHYTEEEVEANARLIASAPELLAAVRFAYESLLRLPIPERIGRQAELIACRDAIAKATGQSDQDVQDFFTAKAWS